MLPGIGEGVARFGEAARALRPVGLELHDHPPTGGADLAVHPEDPHVAQGLVALAAVGSGLAAVLEGDLDAIDAGS